MQSKNQSARAPIAAVVLALALCVSMLYAGANSMSKRGPSGVSNMPNGAVGVPWIHLAPRTAAPTAPGDVWYHQARGFFLRDPAGDAPIARTRPSLTAGVTLPNPGKLAELLSHPVLPNALGPGSVVETLAFGRYSTGSTESPTLQLAVHVDGSPLIACGHAATVTGVTDGAWRLHATFIIRTAGSAGSMCGSARGELPNATALGRVNAAAINTTIAHTIAPAARFGVSDAANAITCEGLVVTVR